MEPNRQILTSPTSYSLQQLYVKYSGMLLGYLYAVLKNHQLAEQHLIAIFKEMPQHLDELNKPGANTWCQLQHLAKKQVAGIQGIGEDKITAHVLDRFEVRNRFLSMMDEKQKQIFCQVYYNRKTTAELSKELNIAEDLVRKTLKEAFAIIKKAA